MCMFPQFFCEKVYPFEIQIKLCRAKTVTLASLNTVKCPMCRYHQAWTYQHLCTDEAPCESDIYMYT